MEEALLLLEEARAYIVILHSRTPHEAKAEYEKAIGRSAPPGYWREPIEWCDVCRMLAHIDTVLSGERV